MFFLTPVRCRSAGLAVTGVASKQYKGSLRQSAMQAQLKTQQKAWLDAKQKVQHARCGLRRSSRRGPARQSTRDSSSNVLVASACRSPPVQWAATESPTDAAPTGRVAHRASYGFADRCADRVAH